MACEITVFLNYLFKPCKKNDADDQYCCNGAHKVGYHWVAFVSRGAF
jgi:hypothetical protein